MITFFVYWYLIGLIGPLFIVGTLWWSGEDISVDDLKIVFGMAFLGPIAVIILIWVTLSSIGNDNSIVFKGRGKKK